MKETILIMDDDEGIRNSLLVMFEREGFNVLSAQNGKQGVDIFEKESADVVIADLNMPEMDGLSAAKKILQKNPGTIVIMLTVQPTIKTAVQAMKEGAFDYIAKDANTFDFEEVLISVKKGLKEKKIYDQNIYLREELKKKSDFSHIIGKSVKIKKVIESIEKLADTDSTVLIYGESGTGKELFAQALHYSGRRSEFPFVAINCSAITETLVESELFGHEKGAFTGADNPKKGLFEVADGGTVFLDEIGEMSLSVQSKLLRFLEEKNFRRVGGTKDLKTNVRVVVATNKNLESLVEEKKFREDLFYRLNVIPVDLPPLRERLEDIPLLVMHFIEKYNKILHKRIKTIDDSALNLFLKYSWPGNVRELENFIERSITLVEEAKEVISIKDLPAGLNTEIPSSTQPCDTGLISGDMDFHDIDFKKVVDEFEKKIIMKALSKTKKKKNVASILNLNPRILRYLIKKHGL